MRTHHPYIVKFGENIFMTLKNITEKCKTLLSLGFRPSQVVQYFFTQLWKMVRSSTVSRYLRLYKKILSQRTFLSVDWMNWSYGIVSVIILLLLLGIF